MVDFPGTHLTFVTSNQLIMAKKKTVRLFHGTDYNNLCSILKDGLVSKFEGVYLTDSAESAARWIGFRLRADGKTKMAIIEVEVPEEGLEEGIDHSPMMVKIFGVGKSILSPTNIPRSAIRNVYECEL
jgi:hypothetical protein